MKFKGQGKINICGFEYKKILQTAVGGGGGGVRTPKKNLYPRLLINADVNLKWRNEKGEPLL